MVGIASAAHPFNEPGVTTQATSLAARSPRPGFGSGVSIQCAEALSASKCDLARLRSNVSRWRPDCLAGVVGFELRNVGANYPFEKSLRFLGSSRILATETIRVLSCAVGIRSSGLVPGSRQACRQVRPTTRSRRRPGRPGRHRCRAAARHPRRPLSRSPPPQRLRGSAGRT